MKQQKSLSTLFCVFFFAVLQSFHSIALHANFFQPKLYDGYRYGDDYIHTVIDRQVLSPDIPISFRVDIAPAPLFPSSFNNYDDYEDDWRAHRWYDPKTKHNVHIGKRRKNIAPESHAKLHDWYSYDFHDRFSKKRPKRVYRRYNLYQFSNFVDYVRDLPGYENYILHLQDKCGRHKFRKKIRHIQGFGRRGFQRWIEDEARRITTRRNKARQEEIQKRAQELAQKQTEEKKVHAHESKQKAWEQAERKQQKMQRRAHWNKGAQHSKALDDLASDLVTIKQHSVGDTLQEELATFGLRSVALAQVHLENKNVAQFNRFHARADAIHQTLLENYECSCQQYEISEHAREGLKKSSLDSAHFLMHEGTAISHQIHREFIASIHGASAISKGFYDNFYLRNLEKVLYQAAYQGCTANREGFLQESGALSDFCDSLLTVSKKFARAARAGFDIGLDVSTAILEGIGKGAQSSAQNLERFLQNPTRVITDIADAIGNATIALGKALTYAVTDPVGFGQTTKAVANTVIEKVQATPPRELLVNSVAISTELLGAYAMGTVGMPAVGLPDAASIAAMARQCTTIARAELALASQFARTNKTAQKVLTPITEIFSEAKNIARLAAVEGREAVRNVLTTLSMDPWLIKPTVNQLSEKCKLYIIKLKCRGLDKAAPAPIAKGKHRRVRPQNDLYAVEVWSPKQYDHIRNCKTDIKEIAKNTKIPRNKIKRIKKPCFLR